jgi:hypothetical protein
MHSDTLPLTPSHWSTFLRLPQAALFVLGLIVALPVPLAAASLGTNDLAKFSGRADRVGETDRSGGLRWEARFEAQRPDAIDLSSGVRIFIGGALTELDGTSLFSIDGLDVSTVPLEAARSARADRSKFQFAGRDRSGTRAQITWRDGRLKIKLQSGRANLQAPAACVGGASEAVLRSTVALEIPGLPRQEFTATQPWKCSSRRSCDGCFDLRAKMGRTGGSGPAGNRPPQASLRFENLTRDRDAANWIRMDARGSGDRDGTIASYEYAISSRSDGKSLDSPGRTMSPVAHVELSPGDYEVRVTVTDDQGQRGTEIRNLSISGAPIAQFGRLGVRWALSESWRLGDPAPMFRVSNAVIPLAEIGEIFTTPAEAPRESNSKRGLETTASSSGNKCGSSMKKAGFFINMATGVVAIGAGMVLGPEATVAIKVGSTAATSAGSTLSYKGGEATTSCLQNQINNLSDEVLFQSQQIAQIQNQLDLTDAAFFTAWTQVLNSQNATFFDAYRQSFNQFSPNPYGTGDSIPPTAQSCQEATPNGPESTCALASGGIFGGFMENAGLWCSAVGQPIPNLCNTPGPQAVATSCSAAYDCSEADSSAPGPYLLQTENNFKQLQIYVDSLVGTFTADVQALTGISFVAECTGSPHQCVVYDSETQLIKTLESLQSNLLAPGTGQLAVQLDANGNIIPLIDAYNQSVVLYINYATTVLAQAFQMEWLVNNFNFFGNLPFGVVPNDAISPGSIEQLGNAAATYYGGPTPETSKSTCTNTEFAGNSCSNSTEAFLCSAQAGSYAGVQCSTSSPAACGGHPDLCVYPDCGGYISQCSYDTTAMGQHYNAAQLELAYYYAQSINLVYELGLQYLVTDLPAGNQAWPVTPTTGLCLVDPETVKSGLCANGACKPTTCRTDNDCPQTAPTCAIQSIPWDALVTSASYCEIGKPCSAGEMTRIPPYIGQPKGWVGTGNVNFDAAPYQSESPYLSGSQCAADYQKTPNGVAAITVPGDPVSGGQPGTIGSAEYICPSDYPYCIGYRDGNGTAAGAWGSCSNAKPWTAAGVVYQYAVNDPVACRSSIKRYNDTPSDDPPNLAGAWQTNEDCPSVFQTPGGQAPRYGYFDGRTLQPYGFQSSFPSAPGACPSECSASTCGAEATTQEEAQGFGCTSFESASSGNGASFQGAAYSTTCSTVVSPVSDGAGGEVCPAFCVPADGSTTPYACVDAGYAQQNLDASLIDCQGCSSSEPVLALAGAMQGNLGACQKGMLGDPAGGPLMDWWAPEAYLTVSEDADNAALLCDGCVYLGCGNYDTLETSGFPQKNTQANEDSLATTYFETANCSSDADASVPCTVAWYSSSEVGCDEMFGWDEKHTSMMASVMVNDYRCGYLGGADVSFIGISNDSGLWSASLNDDAQNGSYPWGCGAFGFNTIEDSGTDGSTDYASLVFGQPNLVTELWDPVVTSDTQHIAWNSGFTASGPQMGLQLVAQCSTNCGASYSDNQLCLSVVTPGSGETMDTLGYSCKSLPNSGEASAFMECTTNDGRMFRIETTPGQGGIENPVSFGATTLRFQEMNQSNSNGTSAVCPDACYDAVAGTGGETFGGMGLNGDDACSGFLSPYGYCGGYCYNQPEIESGAARKPVAPPVDCRGCPPVQTYSACPEGYLPYQGDDEPGGYCCGIPGVEVEWIGDEPFPYPVIVFPYSTSAYGAFTIDHCSELSTQGDVACSSPPCGVNGTRIPSAASSACFPWGNTSMDVLFPFTY